MEIILKITALSVGSIIVLFILTKLMGNKEMSQLSMFDYIISITIGSIAAEMATSLEDNFWEPFIAMVIYAVVTILISYITSKSIKIRRLILGRSIILYDNGELYRNNFKKAKLDLSEFLYQCRNSGYFNLSNIQTAILEPSGKISILPISTSRPITPTDLNLSPIQEKVVYPVIMDGEILEDNLKKTGNSKEWLLSKLSEQKINDYGKVFLATCDEKNHISAYISNSKESKRDAFQ